MGLIYCAGGRSPKSDSLLGIDGIREHVDSTWAAVNRRARPRHSTRIGRGQFGVTRGAPDKPLSHFQGIDFLAKFLICKKRYSQRSRNGKDLSV